MNVSSCELDGWHSPFHEMGNETAQFLKLAVSQVGRSIHMSTVRVQDTSYTTGQQDSAWTRVVTPRSSGERLTHTLRCL